VTPFEKYETPGTGSGSGAVESGAVESGSSDRVVQGR